MAFKWNSIIQRRGELSKFDDLEDIMSLGSYRKEISKFKKLMNFLF